MGRFDNVDGCWLTLGAVATLAVAGAVARRGSTSRIGVGFGDDEDDEDWDEEDVEFSEPDEDEIRDNAVIYTPAWGKTTLFIEGKHIGNYDDSDAALAAFRHWTEHNSFFPSIYVVNERGNTDLVDSNGNILASWV